MEYALDDGRWLAEVVTECTDHADGHMVTLHSLQHPPLARPQARDRVRLKSACKVAWIERPHCVELFIDGELEEISLHSLEHIITLCQGDAVGWAALERNDHPLGEFLDRMDALLASDED